MDPQTLKELVITYQATMAWANLAPSTKRQRRRHYEYMLNYFGGTMSLKDAELHGIRRKVANWRDMMAQTGPYESREAVVTMTSLFNFALREGYMEDNPIRGMRPVAPPVSLVDQLWSDAQVEAFMAHARKDIGDLFTVALWTGLRSGDVRQLCTSQLSEGWIEMRTQKTGGIVLIPYYLSPDLLKILSPIQFLKWKPDAPIFRAPRGRPWFLSSMHKSFSATKKRAALPAEGLRFHDLRGTFMTRCSSAGCTPDEIAVLTGAVQTRTSMRAYIAATRDKAERAYRKLIAHHYPEKAAA